MRNHSEHNLFLSPPPGFEVSRLPLDPGGMRLVHGGQGPALILIHGLGGLLCLRLAVDHPELVDRAIAVCPAGGHDKLRWRWRLLRDFLVNRHGQLRIHWTELLRLYIPLMLFNEWSALARDFSRRFVRRWQGPQGPLLERSFARAALNIFESPFWPQAERLTRPVLMITGRRDLITTKEQTQRLAQHLPPERRLLELGGGHMLPYTHASELSRAALDFCRPPR